MAELLQKSFNAGDVIFRQGDYESCMYEILYGEVSIWSGYGTPEQTLLTTLGPGRFFGEIGVILFSPRTATAVAEGIVLVTVYSASDLRVLIDRDPLKLVDLMRSLSARIRELTAYYIGVCKTAVEFQRDGPSEHVLEALRTYSLEWPRSAPPPAEEDAPQKGGGQG